MKVKSILVLALCAAVVVAEPLEKKRQLETILALAAPTLTKFISDKLHLDKIIGQFVGDVSSFFSGHSGDLPLEGTQLTLHYNIHKCSLHFGKRFIIPHVTERRCTADASENTITHTSSSCEKGSPTDALKCAVEQEVAQLSKLAQQAAAQQG